MAIKWKIDPAHSEIQFRVKHLMISTVTGYLKSLTVKSKLKPQTFILQKKLSLRQI